MKIVHCKGCGSKELNEEDGLIVCAFCFTKYVPEAQDNPGHSTTIGVGTDIQRLLHMCRTEPANAVRYAHLVLDLDPTNPEARAYLYPPTKQKKKWF